MRASSRGTRWTAEDRDELALRIRLRAVRMVAPQGFGYLGQALSAAEQVATVFTTARPGIDRLVCSPGHYVIAPFAAAAEMGLLDEELVSAYGRNGSPIEAIGTERSPVVDYTCGSLGQGLSAAAGFALSDRFNGSAARTYTLISDGEMEEGKFGRRPSSLVTSGWTASSCSSTPITPRSTVRSTRSRRSNPSPKSGLPSAGMPRTSTATTPRHWPRRSLPLTPRRPGRAWSCAVPRPCMG